MQWNKTPDLSTIPQLYLYSQADLCVDSEEIKEIVKLQQNSSGGLEVIEFDFKDSEHVSHFDKYPDKYQKLCLDFLQDMLSKSKEYT